MSAKTFDEIFDAGLLPDEHRGLWSDVSHKVVDTFEPIWTRSLRNTFERSLGESTIEQMLRFRLMPPEFILKEVFEPWHNLKEEAFKLCEQLKVHRQNWNEQEAKYRALRAQQQCGSATLSDTETQSTNTVPAEPVVAQPLVVPKQGFIKWSQLQNYSVATDTDIVFQGRELEGGVHDAFLRRGDSVALTAGTGEGKSVWDVQFLASIGAGVPFCGLDPIKPRKVLLYQCENHYGDLSQAAQGATHVMASMADGDTIKQLWEENVLIASEDELRYGDELPWKVREDVKKTGAEIVVIDPFGAFYPGSMMDEERLKGWLSLWRSVLRETGVVLFCNLHNGQRGQAETKAGQFSAYTTKGDSSIPNFFRAMCVLARLDDTTSRLVWTKRAERLPASEYFLRRVPNKVAWEPCAPVPVLDAKDAKAAVKQSRDQQKQRQQREAEESNFEAMARAVYHQLSDDEVATKELVDAVMHVFACKRTYAFSVIEKLVGAAWLCRGRVKGSYVRNLQRQQPF